MDDAIAESVLLSEYCMAQGRLFVSGTHKACRRQRNEQEFLSIQTNIPMTNDSRKSKWFISTTWASILLDRGNASPFPSGANCKRDR